jgi:prepilin-type N-terminal cleavage/methylation domain-containing protein
MKRGYTLLEMLISVAIFSGLVILILAVFVRTTSSSARVSVLREKSEVARSAMSQISNDFSYIYNDKSLLLLEGAGEPFEFTGYAFENTGGSNNLVLALQYPATSNEQFVVKRYLTDTVVPESRYLKVKEYRGCLLESGAVADTVRLESCDNYAIASEQSVLPDSFFLDNDIIAPAFSGAPIMPQASTGYLKISLNIKPAEYQDELCDSPEVPVGSCYKVETILGAGGLR